MTEAQRRAILESAADDADLVALVPPVVAAGFGILALRRVGDVLTVACFAGASRSALRRLRDVLGLEVVATPFEDRLLHEAIRRAYFADDASVNFPTFTDPDFLDDRENAPLLREEKREEPGPVLRELPASALALATLTYRARLADLDQPSRGGSLPEPRRTKLDLGDLDLAWRRTPCGRLRVYAPGGELPADAVCALNEYRLSDYAHLRGGGSLSEHAVRASLVTELPHLVHPTEVQLMGAAADGSLVFHAYDRRRTFRPGAEGALRLTYYFLSYGHRLRRDIDVFVHEVTLAERSEVEVSPEQEPWSGTELARWFGLAV